MNQEGENSKKTIFPFCFCEESFVLILCSVSPFQLDEVDNITASEIEVLQKKIGDAGRDENEAEKETQVFYFSFPFISLLTHYISL